MDNRRKVTCSMKWKPKNSKIRWKGFTFQYTLQYKALITFHLMDCIYCIVTVHSCVIDTYGIMLAVAWPEGLFDYSIWKLAILKRKQWVCLFYYQCCYLWNFMETNHVKRACVGADHTTVESFSALHGQFFVSILPFGASSWMIGVPSFVFN